MFLEFLYNLENYLYLHTQTLLIVPKNFQDLKNKDQIHNIFFFVLILLQTFKYFIIKIMV